MYQIISMIGEISSETDSPVYSKFNPEVDATPKIKKIAADTAQISTDTP